MKPLPILVLGSLVLATLAVPAGAAGAAPYATQVLASDPDARLNVETILAPAGYVDANGNDAFDLAEPDETMYLDLDDSGTVSFGDLRLNGFFSYAAGSAADYTNRDFGRVLEPARGWFARDAGGAWFFDADASRTVSLGDLRITGDQPGAKVGPGDAGLGAALAPVQESLTPAIRVGWNDVNGNQRRDLVEAVYLDVNVDRQVTPGELRLRATGLGLDDEATRGELAAAVSRLEARDAQLAAEQAALAARDGDLAAQVGRLGESVGSLGSWLLMLGLFTFAGLALVAWYSRKLHLEATGAAAPRRAPATEHELR